MEMDLKVSKFLDQHNQNSGWVVKLPFTTNGRAIKFCANRIQVDDALHFFSSKNK